MTRPFPLQVTENGKIIREVVPIFTVEDMEAVWSALINSSEHLYDPEIAKALEVSITT